MGLAVGDALGTPLKDDISLPKKLRNNPNFSKTRSEFGEVTDMHGGGPFGLKPGEWSNETSMALALSDSLVSCDGMNEQDFMERLSAWYERGEYSHNGKCFDIDQTTKIAISDFINVNNRKYDIAKSYDSKVTGHGTIVRLAPVAMFYNEDPKTAFEVAARQSRTTHCDPTCINVCQYMTRDLLNFYRGFDSEKIWGNDLIDKNKEEIFAGYVESTYDAARWAIQTTDNFKDAVLEAVNLRNRDSDAVGAVTGQMAGAIYGLQGIPEEWIEMLAWKDYILELADKIYYEEE